MKWAFLEKEIYEDIRISENQDGEYQSISKPGNIMKKFFVREEINLPGQEKSISGFEKLWVWQKANKLMLEIHKFCNALPKEERYRIRDQIERSSSSVCDNIAEGYTSYYFKDKIKGFLTARKEAGETQNHIHKLCGKNYLDQKIAREWIAGYEEIIRGINGFVNYIRKKSGKKK